MVCRWLTVDVTFGICSVYKLQKVVWALSKRCWRPLSVIGQYVQLLNNHRIYPVATISPASGEVALHKSVNFKKQIYTCHHLVLPITPYNNNNLFTVCCNFRKLYAHTSWSVKCAVHVCWTAKGQRSRSGEKNGVYTATCSLDGLHVQIDAFRDLSFLHTAEYG